MRKQTEEPRRNRTEQIKFWATPEEKEWILKKMELYDRPLSPRSGANTAGSHRQIFRRIFKPTGHIPSRPIGSIGIMLTLIEFWYEKYRESGRNAPVRGKPEKAENMPKSKRKSPENQWFSGLVVEISGIEPLTS